MSDVQILVVVGTRPEAVKTALLVRALQAQAWARVRVVADVVDRDDARVMEAR